MIFTKLMPKLIWSLKGFQYHFPPSEFKNIVKDIDVNSIKEVYEDSEKYFDFGDLKEVMN